MTKGYLLFMLGSLGAAIFFFNSNSFISMICLLLFIMSAYGAGKLG